jgi:branched-chain amino acid transport system ATP-binding protein
MGDEGVLAVDGLTVRFSGLTALDGLSFRAEPGRILAVIGPNGSGKTTLFNAVSGFIAPTAGTVRFHGADITGLPAHRIAARGICRTFQHNGLFGEMTVLANVLTGLTLSTGGSLAGIVLGWPGASRAEQGAIRRARAMLARMGLAELGDRMVADLSFGQQRLVEIARAMVAGARLIMLDEPAVGLTAAERAAFGESLRRLASEGLGVLLVEHSQELVMAVSDRIVVLNHGRKIAEGAPEQIRADSAVLDAYLGHEQHGHG